MYLLQADGVPVGAVLKGSETINDPHLEACEFWKVVDNPEAGRCMQTPSEDAVQEPATDDGYGRGFG